MIVFLFIIYFIAACFILTRDKFVRNAWLGGKTVLLLFFIKVCAGIVLGMVNHYLLQNHTDYDTYNINGLAEYHNLFHDPHRFFTDIFYSNYADNGEYFGSRGSYWNDLRDNIIFKIIGVTDIFSRGNYYINSLFFNFFSFFGHVALYRVFSHIFHGKKTAVIIGCFLLPSLLYFSSGLHKDALIFTALAFYCYVIYVMLDCGFSRKRLTLALASFAIILLIRNFIAFFLLPPTLCWLAAIRWHYSAVRIFLIAGIMCCAGVLLIHKISPQHDLLSIVVKRQQAFFSDGSTAGTAYRADSLRPSPGSFLSAAPTALRRAYFSPLPGEFHRFFTNLFSVELMAYWLLATVVLFQRTQINRNQFIVFCYGFSFITMLFIGYISPAAGALIRYRSLYLPFIITPLLACIDIPKRRVKNHISF